MASKKFSVSKIIDLLTDIFEDVPGLGRKTAIRFAYSLLEKDKRNLDKLITVMQGIKENIKECSICFNISESDPCPVCSNESRDQSKICVLEQVKDINVIERSRQFKGLYHVLKGVISPLAGIHPSDLTIENLLNRLSDNSEIKEIIIATNPTTEGEVTANYIKNALSDFDVKVTRIAYGVPVGGDLDFVDEVTLSKAFEGRQQF